MRPAVRLSILGTAQVKDAVEFYADVFLRQFPPAARNRGRNYYVRGQVERVARLNDHNFQATVLGTQRYTVSFEFSQQNKEWSAACSCPIGGWCKHAYAAMLAIKSESGKGPGGNWLTSADPVAPAAPRRASPPPVPQQPSPSPIVVALTESLGRPLTAPEVKYVKRIQWLYGDLRAGQPFIVQSLQELVPDLEGYRFQTLKLWPEFPGDDHLFWLYCAWEVRRRNLEIPAFMQPATDFRRIEAVMVAWERQKEIERWRATLSGCVRQPNAPAKEIELRLVIDSENALLQWKAVDESEFVNLSESRFSKMQQEFEARRWTTVNELRAVWHVLENIPEPYFLCHLEYRNPQTSFVLDELLRLPQFRPHIVRPDGTALDWPADPLRLALSEPADTAGDYEISLLRADGSPAAPRLLVLPGRPTLYLTKEAVYSGPDPHGLSWSQPVRIPAPALEDTVGVEFLETLQLPLPSRIRHRIRRTSVAVKLECWIQPAHAYTDTEAVFVRVTATPPGSPQQRFASGGWSTLPSASRTQSSKAPPEIPGEIVVLDKASLAHFPGLLEKLNAKWDGFVDAWRVRLNKSFPEMFVGWLAALPPDLEVYLDRQLASLRNPPVSGSVSLDVQEAGVDWFDLRVVLNVNDLELTSDELKLLLNARGKLVRLGKKGWRRLQFELSAQEDEALARLGLAAGDFTAEPQRLHALQLADQAARKLLPERQAEAIHRRAADLKLRVQPALPPEIGATLRPYQLEGFHFLAYLSANRFGGVLADDMGLGKTVQTLSWLAWLRTEPGAGTTGRPLPSLVICPKSVMDNWHSEAGRFYPSLRVRLWRGEPAEDLASARESADLLVLNYAQLRALSPDIAGLSWQAVILDEGQAIKNPDSQTASSARNLKAEHRLALTGTPIENRLLDLWSLFSFAMPGVLGNRSQFVRQYNNQNDRLARRRLAARVRPFLLRRTKGQVARDLPDRVEEEILCELEQEQLTLYRAEFKRAQQMLLGVSTQEQLNARRFNFLASLLRLRQICCHPALVARELETAESAKVTALLELLEPLMEEGHKVLVFSQFVTMLQILKTAFAERAWNTFYLAGETENRGALVQQFQKSSGAAVFLISLKAGGFGLNLTAASYVVLFDPWWNPAVEMQAIDRTHRIGQTNKVIAYRLLMKDSIEQKIRGLQRAKSGLAEDVLGDEKFAQSLTLEDLRFLFADP